MDGLFRDLGAGRWSSQPAPVRRAVRTGCGRIDQECVEREPNLSIDQSLHPDMEARVVRAAVVLLTLGAVTTGAPLVGAQTPTGDGVPHQSTVVDTQTVPTGAENVVSEDVAPPTVEGLTTVRAGEQPPSPDNGTLNASYTYRRLSDEQGVVEVTMRVPATPGIDHVRFDFQEESTVVTTENVERNGTVYEWTGEAPATIVYRLRIDWSYTGNARASWTLLEHLPPTIRSETAVDTSETIAVAGTGYVGNGTLLLGAHEVYRRQVDGQTIQLVVPGSRSLRYGPTRTVNALANASRSLEIGARDETVHAFATPKIRTEATILEFDGFALDGNTLLVDADAELAAWIHEYAHTRQAFSTAERLRWLTEGSARYYEWLLAVESGYADWGDLRGVFRKAANDDSVLAEPDTWGAESNYAKGALVLATIDREIRTATDGERTLEDALRRINGEDTAPTVERFVRAVRDVAGPDAAATAERYVTTRAVPEFQPDTEALEVVYGYTSPRIEGQVVRTSVVGADGTRKINSTDGQIPMGLSETFRLTAQVENTGDARGLAAVRPRLSTDRLGGDYVDTTWVGWVGPNESVTESVTHRFDRPGGYTVLWNGVRYDVRVAPRGTASVVELTVTDVQADGGRAVVEATVRNDDNRPTYAVFPVTAGGDRVSTTRTVLEGGGTRTVTLRVDVAPSAPTTVEVGTASTTVGGSGTRDVTTTEATAESGSPTTPGTEPGTPTTDPEGERSGIGSRIILAVVAVISTAGLWRWTRQRR
jgi:hypothetical protein